MKAVSVTIRSDLYEQPCASLVLVRICRLYCTVVLFLYLHPWFHLQLQLYCLQLHLHLPFLFYLYLYNYLVLFLYLYLWFCLQLQLYIYLFFVLYLYLYSNLVLFLYLYLYLVPYLYVNLNLYLPQLFTLTFNHYITYLYLYLNVWSGRASPHCKFVSFLFPVLILSRTNDKNKRMEQLVKDIAQMREDNQLLSRQIKNRKEERRRNRNEVSTLPQAVPNSKYST